MRFKIYVLFVFIFSSLANYSQDVLRSAQLTFFTDYFRGPAVVFSPSSGDDRYLFEEGLSYFTYLYDFRYIAHEIDDNKGIGIGVAPTIGAYYNAGGSGSERGGGFSIPLYASLDLGAGSTMNSTKDFGIGIDLGYQYKRVSLFGENTLFHQNSGIKNAWGQPIARLNIRWWGKETLNKLTFRAGLPKNVDLPILPDEEAPKSAVHFMITYGGYFNY